MNRYAFAVGKVVLPPVSWLMCAAGGHGKIAWTETRNKLFIIDTVEFADQYVGKDLTLLEEVRRVYAADPFRALWLGEGVGLHYGMQAMEQTQLPRNLLSEGPAAELPEKILLMAHAGMSMAFARHYMDRLETGDPDSVGNAAASIIDLLKDNSRQGYRGLSFEAFGMVIRFFYGRRRFEQVLGELSKREPSYVPHFWHGAGRALYFVSFLPKIGEPWPALKSVQEESRDDVSRHNLLAGLSAGITMVNMRAPQVMEALIRSRVDRLPTADAEAFFNGMICSTILRVDTTPGEQSIHIFAEHEPAPQMEERWNEAVRQPVEMAVDRLHPLLRKCRSLDEVCYCQPIDQLMARLESCGPEPGSNPKMN